MKRPLIPMAAGVDAAVAQYWDLRKQFDGRAAYDFGEASLITVAQRLTNDKPDAALKLLEINAQYFPGSSRTFVTMSQAHLKKNDKDLAIQDLEKAAARSPKRRPETAVGSAQGNGHRRAGVASPGAGPCQARAHKGVRRCNACS